MDINENVDVTATLGWNGTARVTVRVSDGEQNAYASFNVTVMRRNRPPTISSLPSLQFQQGQAMPRAFNVFNYTTDEDTPVSNIRFAIERNTEPICVVTVSPDGWVDIAPDKKWSGTAWVTVNVSDGEFSARATFVITVVPKGTGTTTTTNAPDLTWVYILLVCVVVLFGLVGWDLLQHRRAGKAYAGEIKGKSPVLLFGHHYDEYGEGHDKRVVHDGEDGGAGEGGEGEAGEGGEEGGMKGGGQGATDVGDEGFTDATPKDGVEEVKMERSPLDAVTGGIGEGAAGGRKGTGGAGGAAAVVKVEDELADESKMETIPEAPAVKVPDVTPAGGIEEAGGVGGVTGGGGAAGGAAGGAGAVEAKGAGAPAPAAVQGAEPSTEPVPGAKKELPSKMAERDIGAGEVEQKYTPKSAAALLAELQGKAPARPPEPPKPEAGLKSKGTEAEGRADELEQREVKPLTKVRCAQCKTVIPVFKAERPLVVTCPKCGKMGTLK